VSFKVIENGTVRQIAYRRCTVTMTTSCIVSETKQIVRNRDFYHHCIWSPR